jgi:hypothetical protein
VRLSITGDAEAALTVIRGISGVRKATPAGKDVEVELESPDRDVPAVIASLVQAGFGIRAAHVIERSLEEVYLEAVGAVR